MKEMTIRYEDRGLLEAMTAMGKYMGFTVTGHRDDTDGIEHTNGIPVTKRDTSVTLEDLKGAFTGMGLNAKELRETAWRNSR